MNVINRARDIISTCTLIPKNSQRLKFRNCKKEIRTCFQREEDSGDKFMRVLSLIGQMINELDACQQGIHNFVNRVVHGFDPTTKCSKIFWMFFYGKKCFETVHFFFPEHSTQNFFNRSEVGIKIIQ